MRRNLLCSKIRASKTGDCVGALASGAGIWGECGVDACLFVRNRSSEIHCLPAKSLR